MPIAHSLHKPPSIKAKAFNCPHCGALAKQFWYSTRATSLNEDSTPTHYTKEEADTAFADIDDPRTKKIMRSWAMNLSRETPFLDKETSDPYSYGVNNLSINRCFNCHDICIWIGGRLIYPKAGEISPPSPDLPVDAKLDYIEAASIVDASPRGAAALLRLAIQKLCVELGGKGSNINDDIKMLVEKGLDLRVQQALDIVRVVGNNAVHPGEIDLRDDRTIAEHLFSLVNLITEVMISQPRHVADIYSALPEGARQAIEKRDTKI